MNAASAPGAVIGRDLELRFVEDFVAAMPTGPVGLVLEGEPGIGKTTVWNHGLGSARARSMTVLSCRPGAAESKLSFAGLTDLVAGFVDRTREQLPEPQRVALDVALLRADPMPLSPDRRAVAMGFLTILKALSTGPGVLVAVDDEQWLDGPTRVALTFAFRRLADMPVGILVARRPSAGVPFELDRALPADRLRSVPLSPLAEPAVRSLISMRSRSALSPKKLAEVTRWSGGNPFLALEMVREQERLTLVADATAAVPVPRPLLEVVTRRITALPEATRRVLLAAAALATPTVDGVMAAAGPSARAALRRAETDGIIATHQGRIVFAHPLLAAAAYDSMTSETRRRTHRRLAETVSNVEEAVRHLSLATGAPDERVARALEEAAIHARARGAPDSATELLQLACDRTPIDVPDGLDRRQFAMADALLVAGDVPGARRKFEELTDASRSRVVRGLALGALSRIVFYTEGILTGAALAQQALELLGDDPRGVTIRVMLVMGGALGVAGDEGQPRLDASRLREELVRAQSDFGRIVDPDPQLRSLIADAQFFEEFFFGGRVRIDVVLGALEAERAARRPVTAERAERALAIALGRAAPTGEDERPPELEIDVPSEVHPETTLGDAFQLGEMFDRARDQWTMVHRVSVESGDDLSAAHAAGHLADIETRVGNWPEAERRSRESMDAAIAFGQRYHHGFSLARLAFLDALQGREASARTTAASVLADPVWRTNWWGLILSWWAVGMLELSLGNFQAADQEFERIGKVRDQLPGAPSFLCYWADRVEALVGTGRLDEAERVTDFFDELTERGPFDWPRALGLRCRAMVSAARGDVGAALESVDVAETLLRSDPYSTFELARTLLISGEIRRRARRKREASERLEEAHEIFDRLGATSWAARARSELGRVGIRPPAPLELTTIEREVARLSASGMTNREVAAAVFVTPKTVEGVLTRVYGKLGIRSRAQLGAMLARPDAVVSEAPEHRGA